MAEKDKRPAEERAVADAVAKALDQLGPLATVTLLERQLAEVRRVERHADYPKAMYGKNGEVRVVESKAEEADLKGFSDKPGDDHRSATSDASGAVAERQERVMADAAARRERYLADPADSTAHSALHGSGVVQSADTTTDLPGLPEPVQTVAAAPAQPSPPTPGVPAPPAAPAPVPVQPKGDK